MIRNLIRPIMMILDRGGPLSTGEICDLLNVIGGPVVEVQPVEHGRSKSHVDGPHWEVCPKCDCIEEVEVSRSYLAPRVRAALKKLARRGEVVEIPTETPNNKGGHLWLRADQVDEYYRQVFA